MIKITHILLLAGLLCLSTRLSAQDERVLLKNGSVLKGQIESIQSDVLQIRIDSASVLSVNTASIRSIAHNRRPAGLSAEMIRLIHSINEQNNKGKFYHQLRFGILNGEDGTFLRSFSSLSMDYTFFRKSRGTLHAGVGVALDYYTSFVAIPFFFELRKDLSRRPYHPFVYGRLGYSRAKGRDEFNGNFGDVIGQQMWALGAGYEWPLGRSSLLISVGIKEQKLQSVWDSFDFRSETDWLLSRLDFKIGLRL